MQLSRLFGRRLRENAGQTEAASHDLLIRAGWIRQHAAGIYSLLTPGLKSLRRIERIMREEMERIGAHEIFMPFVQSAAVWKSSGRHASVDATLVRFRDRRGQDMVLAMTHEEIVAQLAASEIRSYRDVDVMVYQIQTKFRDEARARGGLLRTREFLMKDAYSLHLDRTGLEQAYNAQAGAYARIFRRAGLEEVQRVRSASGDMGGDMAHEFMMPLAVGDDTFASCRSCGEAANLEVVASSEHCARCGGALTLVRAVEVGNIFQLGTRYGEALGAYATDAHGRRLPVVMGSYGIGVSRLLATLVERHHDAAGIALPAAVTAFDVHVIPIGPAECGRAQQLHDALGSAGLDVLLEDRDVRTGEAFADADLMGATLRIVLGGRTGEAGRAEIRERRTGAIHSVAEAEIVAASIRVVEQVRQRERAQP